MRLSDVIKRLRDLGCRIEKPSKGSHWKAYNSENRMFTLPAHNGERSDINNNYLRAMCKELGLDKKAFEN